MREKGGGKRGSDPDRKRWRDRGRAKVKKVKNNRIKKRKKGRRMDKETTEKGFWILVAEFVIGINSIEFTSMTTVSASSFIWTYQFWSERIVWKHFLDKMNLSIKQFQIAASSLKPTDELSILR